jgi:hypothetical protein
MSPSKGTSGIRILFCKYLREFLMDFNVSFIYKNWTYTVGHFVMLSKYFHGNFMTTVINVKRMYLKGASI